MSFRDWRTPADPYLHTLNGAVTPLEDLESIAADRGLEQDRLEAYTPVNVERERRRTVKITDARDEMDAAYRRDQAQKDTMENLERLIAEVMVEARDGALSRITPRTRNALEEARVALRQDIDHLILAWN